VPCHLNQEFGSYLDDEANTVKNLWWMFFPFQKRGEFQSLWDGEKITNLKELVESKGLKVLSPIELVFKQEMLLSSLL